jgi:transcriptional regulator with XRE-family HTH domain
LFNLKKFGQYISEKRKEADLTQSELADAVGVTRQAVSNWECGATYPNPDILLSLTRVFNVDLDTLVRAAELTEDEVAVISRVANRTPEEIADMLARGEISADGVVSCAPYLKASVLSVIAAGFERHGVDISYLIRMQEFLSSKDFERVVKTADFTKLDLELLDRFMPFLPYKSLDTIFEKVIDGELDVEYLFLIKKHFPDYISYSLIEAAEIEGALPEYTSFEIAARRREREGGDPVQPEYSQYAALRAARKAKSAG